MTAELSDLKSYLPDTSIPASDLVGRAVRCARVHWRTLVVAFLPASFFYVASYSYAGWLVGHTSYSVGVIVAIALIGVVVLLYARFELSVVSYAVMLVVSGQAPDLKKARAEALRKWWLVVWVTLPCFFSDLLNMALTLGACYNLSVGTTTSDHIDPEAVFGLIMAAMTIGIALPCAMIGVVNLAFVANLVAERLPVLPAVFRFINLVLNNWKYALMYMLLSTVLIMLFEYSTLSLTFLVWVPDLFKGTTKEIVSVLVTTFNCIFDAPLYALIFAMVAVGGVGLHSQLRMRVDGFDLRTKISNLRTVR